MIFGTIDCGSKPLDIRPVVAAVMEAENWLLARMPAGQRLVVLIGENHSHQSHIFIQQAILDAHLQKKRRFAFGYEADYNEGIDSGDQRVDRNQFDFLTSSRARRHLWSFCKRNSISMSFNDIANKIVGGPARQECLIDKTDPFSCDLVRRHKPHLKYRQISRIHRAGIALSNICMAEKAKDHIERSGSDIYVQHCGQHHVFGNRIERMPYAESLTARFLEKGYAVLPVLLDGDHVEDSCPAPSTIPDMPALKVRRLQDLDSCAVPYGAARILISKASKMNL